MEEIQLADNPMGWSETSRKNLLPNSTSNARCTVCHQIFSRASGFDKHRKYSQYKQESKCVDPSSVGMVLSDKLIWITPFYGDAID